MLNGPT